MMWAVKTVLSVNPAAVASRRSLLPGCLEVPFVGVSGGTAAQTLPQHISKRSGVGHYRAAVDRAVVPCAGQGGGRRFFSLPGLPRPTTTVRNTKRTFLSGQREPKESSNDDVLLAKCKEFVKEKRKLLPPDDAENSIANWLCNGYKALIVDEKKGMLSERVSYLGALLRGGPRFSNPPSHDYDYNRMEIAKLLIRFLEGKNAPTKDMTSSRIADVDFKIESSSMRYRVDLELFKERIDELFEWHTNPTVQGQYMAPYFPIVQSSGMGKTKLMYELKKQYEGSTETFVKLLRCGDKGEKILEPIYDALLHVPTTTSDGDRERILSDLDGIKNTATKGREGKKTKLIVLFDEAQHLLSNDGWGFRVVRWWLRYGRGAEGCQVVASFAGTTSSLMNYYREAPETNTSRDLSLDDYPGGDDLYPPFYMITTMGILANEELISLEKEVDSGTNMISDSKDKDEYTKAVAHGRALFARMLEGNSLDSAEPAIQRRLLLSETQWQDNLVACYSALGTRAQFGQVTFDLASQVVSGGYANLCHFGRIGKAPTANICFMQDPVCARLAMGLMLEGWKHPKGSIPGYEGKAPIWWMQQATQLCSNSFCRPGKGEIGEVAGALYLLFWGDILRLKLDPSLRSFSVPFDEWVDLVRTGQKIGHKKEGEVDDESMHGAKPSSTHMVKDTVTVNCIQFCHHFLRHSLSDLVNLGLLKQWYEAGRAAYAYDGCRAFDFIVPIRVPSNNNPPDSEPTFTYEPLLVNIKNTIKYTKAEQLESITKMREELYKMREELKAMGKEVGPKPGYIMLILMRLDNPETGLYEPEDKEYVVVVPKNDPFGISSFLETVSTHGGELSEVYISHPTTCASKDVEKRLLRSKTKPEHDPYVYLRKLQEGWQRHEEA